MFVSLKSLVLMSCISETKGCQNRRISSVHLGTVHLIFWGGGAWGFFFRKKIPCSDFG